MNYNLNQIMSDNRGDEYFTELLMCGWFAIYMEPVNIEGLSLQESEVEEVRWFDLDEVAEEIKTSRDRFCVPSEGLSILTQYLEGISI